MVTKLMINATNKMVVAGQKAADRQETMPAPLREAAETN